MKVTATMRRKATYEVIGTREFSSIVAARKWAIETVKNLNSHPDTIATNAQVEITINPENKVCPETY